MIELVRVLDLKFVDVTVSVGSSSVCRSEFDGVAVSGRDVTVCNMRDCDEDLAASLCSSNGDRVLLLNSWSGAVNHVGQRFCGGAVEFRNALCKYSVERGFWFDYVKNTKEKVVAVCSKRCEEGCQWAVTGSLCKVNGFFYIKKLVNHHSCGLVLQSSNSKRMGSKLISQLVVDLVKGSPSLTASEVVDHFQNNYGLSIPYGKAWRALEKTKGIVFGDFDDSFKEIGWYVSAVNEVNPGTCIVVDVDDSNRRFKRMFVAFGACIEGFRFCRPMLFIDGTFLKSRFKGVILSATGKDGNQGLFPLAFAVVDSKNQENWYWFLSQLSTILNPDRLVTFISDRNLGLLEAMPKVFPEAPHFFCLHHLKQNLRDRFNGAGFSNSFREHIVHLFSMCAYSPTVATFNHNLEVFKREGGSIGQNFLTGLAPECWSNAFSRSCRYGEMTSNAAESFNSWIRDARKLPITNMVDNIRSKLMEWFAKRRSESLAWNGVLCPFWVSRLDSDSRKCRGWVVRKSSETVFEVLADPTVCVDISLCTCSCRQWQLDGFPCVHAVAAISRSGISVNEVVYNYFHVSTYRKIYEQLIRPVPTMLRQEVQVGQESVILPPISKRQAGRPKKKRIRSRGECIKKIRCGRCGKLGHHNKKSCKEPA